MKRKPAKPVAMYDTRKTRFAQTPSKSDLLKVLAQLQEQIAAQPDEPEPARSVPPPPADKAPLPEDQVQILLKMAESSLRTYGELVPPREVFYLTGTKVCPHCETEKSIMEGFGLKKRNPKTGVRVPQSWCHTCRNSPDSHPSRFSKK